MVAALQECLGIPIRLLPEPDLSILPLYLKGQREFTHLAAANLEFVLVRQDEAEAYNIRQLKRQQEKLQQAFGCPVAFQWETITRSQRDALISHRIPFLAAASPERIDQCYLPFLGLLLQDKFSSAGQAAPQGMTPAAQLLFLLLLYRKDPTPLTKSAAAEKLLLTRTSITRASSILLKLGLLTEQRRGKEIYLLPTQQGLAYYRQAAPYLITPVQRTLSVRAEDWLGVFPLAGESALAQKSMLNAPLTPVRAIGKNDDRLEKVQQVDPLWEASAPLLRLEVWKYPPKLFARYDLVDPVSLACSLSDVPDERLEGALETMLEEYEW